MGLILRRARSAGLRHASVLLIFVLAAMPAVAEDLPSVVIPPPSPSGLQRMPPPSADADAETYARCMKLARQDPAAAQSLADAWRRRGGAHPAEHCAAVALISLGKYKEAATRLQALARAMTKAPTSLRADVLDQAGQAWLLAGDPVQAYAAAGEAVSLAPGDPEILIDRSEAAAANGFLDRAVADLDRVLTRDPNRIDALVYRASANRGLDRLDPARADINRALALAPRSPAALLERGNIRRLQGDRDGARHDWDEIGRLAPGSPADMAARANIERMVEGPGKASDGAPSADAAGKAPAK
jgi:tetratricopeptide (TPR) repeat protein